MRAPEQRFGLAADERRDVFSLAVLAHELLTGQLPGRVYTPVSQLNRGLPSGVDDVLRRGLARKPRDRYGTVNEFRLALIGCLRRRRPKRRAVTAAAVAMVAFAVLGYATANLPWSRSSPVSVPVTTVDESTLRGWAILGDDNDRTRPGTAANPPGMVITDVPVRGPSPEFLAAVPVWPKPRPLHVLSEPGTLIFVHPFTDPGLTARIARDWPRLRDYRLPPKLNLIRNGGFDEAHLEPWSVWDHGQGSKQTRHVQIEVSDGKRAACFESSDPKRGSFGLVLFQRMSPLPPGGSVVVLRCRARMESGSGRLALMPRVPLVVPKDNHSETADRLRARSDSMGPEDADLLPDRWLYALRDWVTPPASWHTYYVIWEQPPFAVRDLHRNLDLWYIGVGKMCVKDVEVFAWGPGD